MKKLCIFFTLFVILISNQFLMAQDAQWTFMVYLDGDNNLESAGIDDFLEMSSVNSDPNVQVVVQFDRIGPPHISSLYDNIHYGDWTTCRRFFITYGLTPDSGNELMDLGEINMGDPNTLKNFIDWTITNYPANHYALVIWNHGSGWRTIYDYQLYKSICVDDTDNDSLLMKEVSLALDSAIAEVDLIGFDACLMGMIEVAYEIRNTGPSVMVGSEEVEPWDGWPYDTILSDLTLNPSWTPARLGRAIVDRYYESYGNGHTQSAIYLGKIETLANEVSIFADTLMNYWDSDRPTVKDTAELVMDKINEVIIREKHGDSCPDAHGIAIYFPTFGFDPDYYDTSFAIDTGWDEFLDYYYDSMQESWVEDARLDTQEFAVLAHIDLYDFCRKISPPTPPSWYCACIGYYFCFPTSIFQPPYLFSNWSFSSMYRYPLTNTWYPYRYSNMEFNQQQQPVIQFQRFWTTQPNNSYLQYPQSWHRQIQNLSYANYNMINYNL